MTPDLSPDQQMHVRNALQYARTRFDSWSTLAKLLGMNDTVLGDVRVGKRDVGVVLTFRLAKILGVGVDALLAETWAEPGMCPRCGYTKAGAACA